MVVKHADLERVPPSHSQHAVRVLGLGGGCTEDRFLDCCSGGGGKLYWSGMVLLTGNCITCAGTGEALTAASLVPGVAPDSVFGSGLCPPNLIPSCMAVGIPGGVWMGVHFLRNFLFLSVSLLDPNVITLYCLVFGSACTTTPLLSHLLGLLPNWFCSITWSPTSRWGSSLVPCFSF